MRALVAFAVLLAQLALTAEPARGFDWSGKVAADARGLNDSDPGVRLNAVRALAAHASGDALRHLLAALSDDDPTVRLEAARALARHQVVEAVPLISEWLKSPDRELRTTVAELLGTFGDAAATAAIGRALGDAEPTVRRAAVEALGRIGGASAVLPLIGRLDDEQVQVRRAAVERLRDLGDVRAVLPLLERLSDSSAEVRVQAVLALGRLADAGAGPALVRLLREPDYDLRIAAVESLGHLRLPETSRALSPLLYRTPDELGAKVAEALGRIADAHALEALVRLTRHEPLRLAATEALKLAGAAVVGPLAACLDASIDACDVATAVEVLGALGDARAVPALVAELERGRLQRRDRIVEALARLADPRTLGPLLALLGDPDAALRRLAASAITPMLDARAISALLDALDDPDEEVRARVIDHLGNLSARAAVPRLLELATGGSPHAGAIAALGRIGDPRATRPLLALLDGANADLVHAAAEALAALGDPASLAPLLARATGTGPIAGRRAALAALRGPLRRQRDPAALRPLEALAAAPDTLLALDALDVLAAAHDPTSLPVVATLADDARRDVRRAALETLGQLGDAARAAPFLARAVAADDDGVRCAALWAVGRLGGAALVAIGGRPRLLAFARSHAFCTAVNASAALVRQGASREELAPLLAHANPYVRVNAAAALTSGRASRTATSPFPAAIATTLLAMAEADPHRYPRLAAIRALGLIDVDAARALLTRLAAGSESESLRRAAKTALAPPTAAPNDDWLHIWWSSEGGGPLIGELYVVVLGDGLAKAGYTDARGEAGEERIPRAPWEYQCLGAPGAQALLTLDACQPSAPR